MQPTGDILDDEDAVLRFLALVAAAIRLSGVGQVQGNNGGTAIEVRAQETIAMAKQFEPYIAGEDDATES